ncbi:hypothetical protein [uncultured Sphingomonas sp.]|uniref:hypothetical protein n=1 Tax=uncultured Sphingomonas sp. TaxID=158754 RepID=UPI0035CC891C
MTTRDPFATIRNVASLDRLVTLETNYKLLAALTTEIEQAIDARYADFGREMIAAKTSLDLSEPSPAERRIANAVGRYVALQKRDGKAASRTFRLLANRGLIDAAEATIAKPKATQGFKVLDKADLRALSFEQIIVDHPEEFSARASWFAHRTLGLANVSDRPPADIGTPTQQRTATLLNWLARRAAENHGLLNGHTNADVGRVLGFNDLSRHGRVLGNIQSRIDFACYIERVPPLGLCVVEMFANAWAQEGRAWRFPVPAMREAAQTFGWTDEIIARVEAATRTLPGQAAISWRRELAGDEAVVRDWAERLRKVAHPSLSDGEEGEGIPDPDIEALLEAERRVLDRRPEIRERVSRLIERGAIGQHLKQVNGYKCQVCEALGHDAMGFRKSNGELYVEAHHVTPVSELELGSLSGNYVLDYAT